MILWFNRVFEIIRCKFCGSSGTHRKCSSLKLYDTNWTCADCNSAVEGTGILSQTVIKSALCRIMASTGTVITILLGL